MPNCECCEPPRNDGEREIGREVGTSTLPLRVGVCCVSCVGAAPTAAVHINSTLTLHITSISYGSLSSGAHASIGSIRLPAASICVIDDFQSLKGSDERQPVSFAGDVGPPPLDVRPLSGSLRASHARERHCSLLRPRCFCALVMANRQRRTQRGEAVTESDSSVPASSRKRKRQQPAVHTDTTSDEASSLDSQPSPAPPAAVPAASLTDIAALNDQSLSAVNQLLSKRYKKPVAHRTVAQPQRHETAAEDEEAVWEADDTVATVDAEELHPVVAVVDGEQHDVEDDVWQTDDTSHLLHPPPLESADHNQSHSLSHSDNDDEQHSQPHSHRTTAEEADAYRQQQLDAIATASSSPPTTSTQLAHRTEVAVDEDNQPAGEAEHGGAINIELPKDLVNASKAKSSKQSKADKAAAAAAAKEKRKYPHLTAEAKSLRLRMQKLHLLFSIALLQRYSAVADNEELQGQLLSLLPARLMLNAASKSESLSPLSGASTSSVEVAGGTNLSMATFGVDWVKQITSWFHHLTFLAPPPPASSPSPASPTSSPSSSPGPSSSSALPLSLSPLTSLCSLGHLPAFFNCLAAQLTSALSQRRTQSPHAKLLLFLALLRSLHINVRLVHAIEQTAYPWEQIGWMQELRSMAVSTRVKVDVGKLKEMRIGGRMVQVIDKRDNLRRMWRVALPRTALDVGSACACGNGIEWRNAGLASTVVPPAGSVSLMGRKVSISRTGSGVRDEVVISEEDDEVGGKEEKFMMHTTARQVKARPVASRQKHDEDEDKPLASKLTKKGRRIAADVKPAPQRAPVKEQSVAADNQSSSPTSDTIGAAVKVEAGNSDSGSSKVKHKRRQRDVSKRQDSDHRADEEKDEHEEDDDAAVYAASMRRRKARGSKVVKQDSGQRRSERVKQQAEADIIVLSSDDEEAVMRIKQQAEQREIDELRRLQHQEDEEQEEEGDGDYEEAENMVRPKRERVEVAKRDQKAVKRRLLSEEENLVSSEDSDVDVPLKAESSKEAHSPQQLFTVEEKDELVDVPLVSTAVDNTVSSAVDAMMVEAKQADHDSGYKHASSNNDVSKLSSRSFTANTSSVRSEEEEVKVSDRGGFRQTSCFVCGSHRPTASNPILLCDACDRECHLKCATPPLNKVPKGSWFCSHCSERKEDSNTEPTQPVDEQEEERAEISDMDDDFVPQKRTKRKAGSSDGKRKKSSKRAAVKKADEPSQPIHVFDRYQFGGQFQNGKEEKVEAEDAAVNGEDDHNTDGDNNSVVEDISPRKKETVSKKRSAKRGSSSPSTTSSSPSRSRRSSSATSSPTTSSSPSASSGKKRSAATDPTGMFLPFWLEVQCPSAECWIHVDPVNNWVDAPTTYESLKPRRVFSYVLAAYPPIDALQRTSSGYGFASASATALPYMDGLERVILDDVTARYGVGSAMLPRGRLAEDWWEATLDRISASRTTAFDRRIHEAEQASFLASRSTSLAELPTTQAALSKHPLYITLDKVKKFEMLRPGAPVAARTTVAKQQVALYWRKDVHTLHTAERWVREKRQVREDEVGKPAKLVKSMTMQGRKKRRIMQYVRGMQGDFDRLSLDAALQDMATSSSSTSATTLPDDDEMSALYGIWQTVPWAPPVSIDGVVPRNARGQVDLWTPAHLPVGCAHLPYPRIAAIARKLGVDYAEAMVGFEVRGGRSIPKFEGIVVTERNAEWVLDAYREKEREVKEKEDKKRWERVSFNWRRLVKGAVVRAKLMAELKDRNESLEGKDEEQKSSKKGKTGKRGKKAQPDEDDSGDEERPKGGKASVKRKAVVKESAEADVVNDVNHVHDFSSNKTMNRETGSWVSTCRCGARNEFEQL